MMQTNTINYRKDVVVNTIAQILYLFALWVMTIITPRIGSSADAGVFTIALSISNICTAIATYSINFYVASDIKHQHKDQHYLYFGLTSTFISLLVSLIIILSFGYYNDSVMFWAVILFYVFKCAENITLIITASVQRAGKLYLSGYALIVKAIITLGVFTLTLLLTKNIVLAFGLIAVLAFLYLFFVDFQILRKYTNESYKVTKEIYKASLKLFLLAFPAFLFGVSFAAIGSFPRIVLNQYETKEVVGYFGTMAAITSVIQSGVSAMLVPFLPKLALSYQKHKKYDLFKIIAFFMALILIGTALAFVLSVYLDKWLIGILYPSDSRALDYAYYFKWIVLIAGLQALVLFFCLLLIALRKLKHLCVCSAAGLLIMFAVSYPLIMNYSIFGVIYTFALGYGVMCLSSFAISIFCVFKNN